MEFKIQPSQGFIEASAKKEEISSEWHQQGIAREN